MDDIKKFFKENKPEIADADKFISEIERQLDLLPASGHNELLEDSHKKTIWKDILNIATSFLVSIFVCLTLSIILRSIFSTNIPDILFYIIITVTFSATITVSMVKKIYETS